MLSLAVGDEVQRVEIRRSKRGLYRTAAGIADRPGRQPVHHVGVVRRLYLQVVVRQPPLPVARLRGAERVLRGGVRLQRHLLVVAVDIHRRYERALGVIDGLTLDYGGDHERFTLIQPRGETFREQRPYLPVEL